MAVVVDLASGAVWACGVFLGFRMGMAEVRETDRITQQEGKGLHQMSKFSEVDRAVSEVLLELIERSGKTVSQVADDCGIPKNNLYYLVSGRRQTNKVDVVMLNQLAKYFGYDINVFLHGPEEYERTIHLSPEEQRLVLSFRRLGSKEAEQAITAIENPPAPLRAEEERLLALIHKLNQKGLERLLETCDDLVSSGKYSLA